MSETKKIALRAVLADRPIAYHPILARISRTIEAGILLGQLLYWDGVMSRQRGKKWDGWFYKTAEEIMEETALSRSNFETARSKLKELGFIKCELHGVPATMHYWLDIDSIEEALEAHANKIAETPQSSLQESSKLVRGNPANKIAETPPTIHKNTHESTQENTISSDADAQKDFAAVFRTLESAMGHMSPRECELVRQLWEEKPNLDAHHYAYLQTQKYANGFNLKYYERCLNGYRPNGNAQDGVSRPRGRGP